MIETAAQTETPRWLVVVALLTTVFVVANGTFMLVNPEAWYWSVPGVPDTGPFNPHFVRDIAFVYLLSGVALAAGIVWPQQRIGLWGAAAAWQLAHALFHVWEVVVGICGPEALLRDFLGVTLPAIVTVTLTAVAARRPTHAG